MEEKISLLEKSDTQIEHGAKCASVSGMFMSRYATGWWAFGIFILLAIIILNSSGAIVDRGIVLDERNLNLILISLISVYLVAGLVSYFAYKLFEITISKDFEGNPAITINSKAEKGEILQIKGYESFACKGFERRINLIYFYNERPLNLFLVVTTKTGHQVKLQGEFTRLTKINHNYYDLPFYRAEYTSENGHKKIEEMIELLKSSNAINVGRESDDELEE